MKRIELHLGYEHSPRAQDSDLSQQTGHAESMNTNWMYACIDTLWAVLLLSLDRALLVGVQPERGFIPDLAV